MKNGKPFRVLYIRPPYTRLKGLGQASYFPLGIGYLTAVTDSIPDVEARMYHAENQAGGERDPVVDKQSVFQSRSQAQKNYFSALDNDRHPVWNEIESVLTSYRPDAVGLGVLTPEVGSALKISRMVKSLLPGTRVVWGGVHPTFCAGSILEYPFVDYIVSGEGESTIRDLIECMKNDTDPGSVPGVVTRSTNSSCIPRPLIQSLDEIPLPARDKTIFPGRYSPVAMGSIMYSRGCPWRCGFCSSRRFWREKVRFRDPEAVTAEIRRLITDYGIRTFTFWDDTFTINRTVTERICEAIIRLNTKVGWRTATRVDVLDNDMLELLKRAGCFQIELGIETGSPEMLEKIRKDIDLDMVPQTIARVHKHKIACGVFFMAGFPDETGEDLLKTDRLIRAIKPAEIVLNVFDPMPGSEQYERTIELGLLPPNPDFARMLLWPDAHYAANIERDEFSERIEMISRYIFSYNTSKPALCRRALPEIGQLLRTDRKALLRKSYRFFKNRFGFRYQP
ncbi:radical SAM protein [bacterium]|nr:radical SAM protein [candidate division CSSED10-310 bacterium]